MLRMLLPIGALWLWLVLQQPLQGASRSVSDLQNQAASQKFFTNGTVCQLHIDLPKAGFEALKKDGRKFAQATLREGSNTYTKIGLHLKGNSTFKPIDGDKPNFTLKFNVNVPGQRFHGL